MKKMGFVALVVLVQCFLSGLSSEGQAAKAKGRVDRLAWADLVKAVRNVNLAIYLGTVVDRSVFKRHRATYPHSYVYSCVVSVEKVLKAIKRDVANGGGDGFWFVPTFFIEFEEARLQLQVGKRYLLLIEFGKGLSPVVRAASPAEELRESYVRKIQELVRREGRYGNGGIHEWLKRIEQYERVGVKGRIGERHVDLRKWGLTREKVVSTGDRKVCVLLPKYYVALRANILSREYVSPKEFRMICRVVRGVEGGVMEGEIEVALNKVQMRRIHVGLLIYIAILQERREGPWKLVAFAPVMGLKGPGVREVEAWLGRSEGAEGKAKR